MLVHLVALFGSSVMMRPTSIYSSELFILYMLDDIFFF